MDNLKKIGLTALAGSLVAFSAQAAEMSVSGATALSYTSEDPSEVDGNPYGMKTNLSFTASGDVNGYTVSYMQTSADQFAGMSSARLSVDMGDMGLIAFDQGSGSGLSTIDDKTPTAGEEIWDGLDGGAVIGGLVGASSYGAWNYVHSLGGVGVNASYLKQGAATNGDGASSGAGHGSSWDVALTAGSDTLGVEGLSVGAGYGDISDGSSDADDHTTIFANYSMGMATFGYQISEIDKGVASATNEKTDAWGLAVNVNDNLSLSYGEREVEFDKQSATNVTEEGEGFNVAYTMGSMKVLATMNEVKHNNGTANSNDEMTEIVLSFAF